MHPPGASPHGHSAEEFDLNEDEVTCRQFVELLTDYFEGALPSRTRGQMEEHLVMCDWCVTYAEQMQATIDSLTQLRDAPAAEPSDAVLAVLRARRTE